MSVIKYHIKAFYGYDKEDFKELKAINITLNSSVGELFEVAKIRVSRNAFITQPKFIKIKSSVYGDLIMEVSEVLRVDNYQIEIIAKTPLRLISRCDSFSDFGKINENAEFRGDLARQTPLKSVKISEFSDIANKLENIGVKYWAQCGKSVFDSAWGRGESEGAIKEFSQSDFISFNVSKSEKERIGEVVFNQKNIKDLEIEPVITMLIDPSPQAVSPLVKTTYTNEENGDIYIISPLRASGKVFTNMVGALSSNIALSLKTDYLAVEEYELSGDESVSLAGYIKELMAVEIEGVRVEFHAKNGDDDEGDFYSYNTLCFSEAKYGRLKVSYKTDCYLFELPPLDKEASKRIKLGFYNAEIDYEHKYELNGFYPLNLEHKISVIKDFNIDSSRIGECGIMFGNQLYRVDEFGEFSVAFHDYGYYKLTLYINGVPSDELYIRYFANEFNKSFNKVSVDGILE